MSKKPELSEERLRAMELTIARDYFVRMQYDTKDIAEILNVSQRTVQNWAEKEDWRRLRDATKSLPATQMQIVINLYSRMLDESQKDISKIRYDLIAKLNRTIRDLEFVAIDSMQMQTISKDFIIFLYESKKSRFIKIAFQFLEEFQLWRKNFKK